MGGLAAAAAVARSPERQGYSATRGAVHPCSGLYTGTRAGAICGAAFMPTIGRGYVDLDAGRVLSPCSRRQRDEKAPAACPATAAAVSAPAPLATPPAGIAIGGRVERSASAAVNKAFRSVRQAAGLGADVTPHILRHTAATWLMQPGSSMGGRGFLGMTAEKLDARATGTTIPITRAKPLKRSAGARQLATEIPQPNVNERRRTSRKSLEYSKSPVAHHVRDVGVAGSNPATPTNT